MPDQAPEASQAESAHLLLEHALPESLAAFDCAFGVDLCWNEYTCDALATALLAFALSSSHISETAPCDADGSIRCRKPIRMHDLIHIIRNLSDVQGTVEQ